MRRFTVTARGLSSVEVEGRNWVVALGLGLAELGREDMSRLACEVLPNGTVIARDITSGTGFVVQALEVEASEHDEAVDDPDTDLIDAGAPPLDDEVLAYDEGDASPGEDEGLAELPVDAIQPLDATEALALRIGNAETVLMACNLTLLAALKTVPAESGAVILEERGHMRFTAVHGPSSRKLIGVRLPMGTGVAGFALEHGRTIVLADASEDPRHCAEVDALTGYQTRSIAVIPVQADDVVYGVLELLNIGEDQRFTEEQVQRLQRTAALLADRLHEDAVRATQPPLDRV